MLQTILQKAQEIGLEVAKSRHVVAVAVLVNLSQSVTQLVFVFGWSTCSQRSKDENDR